MKLDPLIKLFKMYLILLLMILISCKDDTVNPADDSSFYPTNVGNSWEYDLKYYDSLGVIEYEASLNETFVSSREKEGELVYQFSSPLNPPSPPCCDYKYYFQNKTDGVHRLVSSDSTGYWVDDYLWYKYPSVENDFFTNGRNDYDTTFVISLKENVVCEAGTFNCIVYRNLFKDFQDTTFSKITGYSNTYVAYGIGKIKYETYSVNSTQQFYKIFEYSLKKYNLN